MITTNTGGTIATRRAALRNAARQATVDLRSTLRGWGIFLHLSTLAVILIVVFFVGGNEEGAGGITGAQYVLPSLLAASLALSGFTLPSGEIVPEREDGSLLRMKAVPGGMRGYVMGKMMSNIAVSVVPLILALAVAIILRPELAPATPLGWVRLLGFIFLGLVATIPVGVAFGSVVRSALGLILPMFFVYALMGISGIFFPMAVLPGWVQVIGQVFPMYWLGLGMRSAFLPAEAAVLELGGSWQTLETLAVLGGWAVLGLVLAPILLRRMVRGVSGSTVSAARERMLSRGY